MLSAGENEESEQDRQVNDGREKESASVDGIAFQLESKSAVEESYSQYQRADEGDGVVDVEKIRECGGGDEKNCVGERFPPH